jgi:hypothetical protein
MTGLNMVAALGLELLDACTKVFWGVTSSLALAVALVAVVAILVWMGRYK